VDFLPIFLNIKAQRCLVVGGGKVAARKVLLLKQAGAQVSVVSPELCQEVARSVAAGEVEHINRPFEDDDLQDRMLVVAATSDTPLNERISLLCRRQNTPVNVVDNQPLCSFIMPSIIDRSPVQIAISTGGASPVLARMLRTRLENLIPAAYGRLATLVDGFRTKVKEAFPNVEKRRAFWERTLEGSVAELVFAGRDGEARIALEQAVAQREQIGADVGEVYLVGAGPGDPDLLSFRALRLMQQADVVVYDRLVAEPILELVRRDAERIYAGKERDNHSIPQEGINSLLARLAKEGKRVLRLKGGDPFIFGRGGEEIATLIDEGVTFQVVPGITAASGCATYAGIPLTHRDHTQACIFVTGNLKDGSVDLNWPMLSHANQTVVFYMGLHGVKIICEQLIAHGRDKTTPAALVQQGTTPDQRVFIGDLSNLSELVAKNNVKAPTLIIVGEVVQLHEKLSWFKPGDAVQAEAINLLGGMDGQSLDSRR